MLYEVITHLPGFLSNTRPYSLQAVRSAVGAASGTSPQGMDAELVRWLSGYTGPTQAARLTVEGGHADARTTPWNHDGIPVPGGWSGQASFFAREEKTSYNFV